MNADRYPNIAHRREEPPMTLHDPEEAEEDLRRLYGDAPYNTPNNPCLGDPYYAAELRKKYGVSDLAELRYWCGYQGKGTGR